MIGRIRHLAVDVVSRPLNSERPGHRLLWRQERVNEPDADGFTIRLGQPGVQRAQIRIKNEPTER